MSAPEIQGNQVKCVGVGTFEPPPEQKEEGVNSGNVGIIDAGPEGASTKLRGLRPAAGTSESCQGASVHVDNGNSTIPE
jgi:hypothetical protein